MTANRLVTGLLFIAVPLIFTAGFTGLQTTFDYPEILRQPAADVLARFAAGGTVLRLFWYAMFVAALGLIPAATGFAVLAWRRSDYLAALSAAFGVLAGLVQALGLLRWVMLVPHLAAIHVAPETSDLDRALAAASFDAANHYLGMGVGEHLGYLFTALWTLAVAAMIGGRLRIFALLGVLLALGIAFGMAEPFGVPAAGAVNAFAFTGWSLWALVLGVLLLWRPRLVAPSEAAG
jgi:hypothetical protein